ncbi:uncharacterized protein FIBRA_03077 [Fibroporia radiculosa]|uniref:Protein BIG1 n=1 Tax=Fibroporia radiculosa TaxID=599839 RepID=J4H274_9APHY|nr:uncharacterized protein FIBRA_03077 [Fibroporia radiculosa]CCM01029.1 predicted protein [Fibroporia radiculosa]
MARRAVYFLLALLPATAIAFSNTHPIVAWSSHSSNGLNTAPLSKSTHVSTLLESLLWNDNVCEHDAIVLVNQRGLHASDLRTLAPSGGLAQSLNAAASTLELPYVPHISSNPFSNLASTIAERCGARVISYVPGQTDIVSGDKGKHVMCMEMPALDDLSGLERKTKMAQHESRLSSTVADISEVFPKHLVVYAGWSPSLNARQSTSFSPALAPNSTSSFVPPSGGILAHYQLLTPGLILSMIIGFFVLIPIVLLGVSALASIQSPLQGEPPKGYIASEKKNQ